MELELRNLKIDRTARREKQGKPITNMIAVAVIVALAAIGLVFLVIVFASPDGILGLWRRLAPHLAARSLRET